jgi:hypothetical protein
VTFRMFASKKPGVNPESIGSGWLGEVDQKLALNLECV